MAKRYIKIGWENKPSVKTPVNMTNLGRMDKGIDDCDNAIEEIYAKRVNNVVTTNEDTFLAGPVGKVLQDQVTELNKNLTNILKVTLTGYSKPYKTDIDLNTVVDYGIYVVGHTNPTYNAPAELAGVLLVFGGGTVGIYQIIFSVSNKIYVRNYLLTAWSAWKIWLN